ncbi:hypothetical protein C8Q80DRAFT_1145569 [Daedaleopsis nitida]|nr:hypothetical protein C8Q80DRAFT_1145569 [Daedaleopsis nitida]
MALVIGALWLWHRRRRGRERTRMLLTADGDNLKKSNSDQVAEPRKSATRVHSYRSHILDSSDQKTSPDDESASPPDATSPVSSELWRPQQPGRPSRPLPHPPHQYRSSSLPSSTPPICAFNPQKGANLRPSNPSVTCRVSDIAVVPEYLVPPYTVSGERGWREVGVEEPGDHEAVSMRIPPPDYHSRSMRLAHDSSVSLLAS